MDNADTRIDAVGLSVRAVNALRNRYYLDHQLDFSADWNDITFKYFENTYGYELMQVGNCGRKTLNEIINVMDNLELPTDRLRKNITWKIKPNIPKPPNPDGLKDCPFCYSAGKYLCISPLSGYGQRHWVKCIGGGEGEDCEARTSYWTTREGAIEAWNRRKKRVEK